MKPLAGAIACLVIGAHVASGTSLGLSDPTLVLRDHAQIALASAAIEIGAFAPGFEPTPQNRAQWAAHWVATGGGYYEAGPGTVEWSAEIVAADNQGIAAGERLYAWAIDGLEWGLFGDPDWVMPVASPLGLAQTLDFSTAATALFGRMAAPASAATTFIDLWIAADPAPLTAPAGTEVVLSVTAGGTAPLTYQWQFEGAALPGATLASLTLSGVRSLAAGDYTVSVGNAVGSVRSLPATLTVTPAPATVQLSGLVAGYDGSPHPVTATTTPPGLAVSLTYDGAPMPPTQSGIYIVAAAIADPDYTGSASATLIIGTAPTIAASPVNQLLVAGDPLDLAVTASGYPPPAYQWRKNGVALAGATGAAFRLAAVALSDAGRYDCLISNALATQTSDAAQVAVLPGGLTASQSVAAIHFAGRIITLSTRVDFPLPLDSLSLHVLLPAGWTFVDSTNPGHLVPTPGDTGLLAFAWTQPPDGSLTFTYRVSVPPAEPARALTALVSVTSDGSTYEFIAAPDPLPVVFARYHSADINADGRIGLTELLRVIVLYNYRDGTVRTGEYHPQDGTADGFAPGPGSRSTFHTADFNRDGRLSLTELLRVIVLYNYRQGTVRTGEYHLQSGTTDSYAPGS